MSLKRRDYPGRGIPDAANEAKIEYQPEHFGYAMFVVWTADDARGNPVKVLIGFPTVVSGRINGVLLGTRDPLEAAANANYKRGDKEVLLFAPAMLAA